MSDIKADYIVYKDGKPVILIESNTPHNSAASSKIIEAYATKLNPKYEEYIKEAQKKLKLNPEYIKTVQSNLWELTQFMDSNFERVDPIEFYREIFPNNQTTTDSANMTPNGIFLYFDAEKERKRRRIMFSDTWEEEYIEYVEKNPMTLCSGISYFGKRNRSEHAGRMHAMIFDIDGVTLEEMKEFMARFGKPPMKYARTYPMPTFISLSGSGIHIYYVFDKPIDLYPNIKLQLNTLKHELTYYLWDYKSTSKEESVQFQSIFQGFRMVGSVNSKYGNDIVAFKTGNKVSLDILNNYVERDKRVDINKPFAPTKYTLAEAQENFKDWYQRKIVEGNKRPKKWDIAGKQKGPDPYALYHWWLNKVKQATGGHRYYFMMCAVIYGSKCSVPKAQIEEDLWKAFEELKNINHKNPLTEEDVESALSIYARDYYNFTIEDIQKLSAIRFEKNKRRKKPLKRSDGTAFKAARMIQELQDPEGTWRNKDGRPLGSSKQREIVEAWQIEHPAGTKKQCKDETGLSYPTIRRWWRSE